MKKVAIIRGQYISRSYYDDDDHWRPLLKETDFEEVDDETYEKLRSGMHHFPDTMLVELVSTTEAIGNIEGALKKIDEQNKKWQERQEKAKKIREEKALKRSLKKRVKTEEEELKLLEELKNKYMID
jgi:hypothetical protein